MFHDIAKRSEENTDAKYYICTSERTLNNNTHTGA